MGIIKAASHAVGTGLSDQWLEALEPDNMGAQTVFAKGVQLRKGTGENGKGSDNMVTEGSIIHVYPEQCMILVDGGKVVDYTAEPGYYKVSLDTQPSLTDEGSSTQQEKAKADRVAFEDVSFTYAGSKEPALSHISFTAKPGETIGIIGGTGCGKSTLVNLIPRFYDASEGSVVIDGNNAKEYPFSQLRKKVGMVPQQAVLFKGTIRDNMKWGKEDATEEEIQRALSIAQASDFVNSKPEGLNTMVSQGGANLSGGQRQRLTIARALVGDPEILIMDDSASALDFATDAALRHAIHQQTKGMTVFIVSQRATSIKQADKILVLDDGELVGVGTHKELMESCEVYREICLSQLSEQEVNR